VSNPGRISGRGSTFLGDTQPVNFSGSPDPTLAIASVFWAPPGTRCVSAGLERVGVSQSYCTWRRRGPGARTHLAGWHPARTFSIRTCLQLNSHNSRSKPVSVAGPARRACTPGSPNNTDSHRHRGSSPHTRSPGL
jgi:hypothetical protein